ncbi:MAG: sugar phosphate isomerase/epimerase [Cyclobacteriaceae bacterium]|nr:sugar phosphate isomerase/epimerase [Cyclobacteriaceae bacterium]
MRRKEFIKSILLVSAMTGMSVKQSLAALSPLKKLKKPGIQLFSVPALLEKNFRGAITLLAEMGYKEVELFGPYDYSAQEAKDSWNSIKSFLPFGGGSGYFGLDEKQIASIMKESGITIPSIHTDLISLKTKMEHFAAASESLGFKYVVLPSIPENERKTMDDYKRMADTFNKIGEEAQKVGLRFGYHNHGYGLQEVDGNIPLQILLDATDPELVFLEMDIFWTFAGKADPLTYLKKYSGRYKLLHLKDMKEKATFSGDGSDASQWIELFPYMTSIGEGVVDIQSIISTATKNGAEHFFVEQDMVREPEIALKTSIDNLKLMKF